jgi:fucose 4-O-acetylase-like acetyltransferase
MDSSQSKKNIYFINVAKTLAIFLMVLAHLPISWKTHAFINGFHMPLFFIITGLLISVETISFPCFLIKKIRTLLLPYFVFAGISLIFWYFAGSKYGDDAGSEQNLTNYFAGALLAIPTKEFLGFNFPIWYLPSLFCAEILFYQIREIFKKYCFITVVLLLGLGILLKEMNCVRLPYGIDVSLFAIFFIQIGQWLKDKNRIEKYICIPSLSLKLILSIVFFCLTLYITWTNVGSDRDLVPSMAKRIFNNYFLYFTGAIFGSLFILYLSNCTPKISIFNFYGRNTIIILCLHIIVLTFVKGIQVFLLQIPLTVTEAIYGINPLYCIVTFILFIPIIYCFNTWAPFLIGRKKGIL